MFKKWLKKEKPTPLNKIKPMGVDEFVQLTIEQLIDGVVKAQLYAVKKGAIVNPRRGIKQDGSSRSISPDEAEAKYGRAVQFVDFDIALEVTDIDVAEGKSSVGIAIAGVGNIGVSASGRVTESTSQLNKIHFKIPISFPNQPDDLH